MWKKLGNSASIPLESSLNSISSESVSEMLMSAINNSSVAQEELAPNPEHESSRNGGQTLQPLLRDYADTVEKCTKSASEFVRCASLLSEARNSFDRLGELRSEIRRVLAADEEKLGGLMDEVRKIADAQLPDESAEPTSERKAPESSKIADISAANGEKSKMMRFP